MLSNQKIKSIKTALGRQPSQETHMRISYSTVRQLVEEVEKYRRLTTVTGEDNEHDS